MDIGVGISSFFLIGLHLSMDNLIARDDVIVVDHKEREYDE